MFTLLHYCKKNSHRWLENGPFFEDACPIIHWGIFPCHVSVQKDNLLVRPQRKNSQVCFLLGFTWFDPFLPNKKIKGFRSFKHVFRICVVQFVLFNACCLFAPPFLKKDVVFSFFCWTVFHHPTKQTWKPPPGWCSRLPSNSTVARATGNVT